MNPGVTLLLALLVGAFAGSVSAPAQTRPACSAAGPDIACTGQGAIRGAIDGDVLSFKGIPYASPPVGTLRWRAPEPPAAWQGVRDGIRFGPICPQIVGKQVVGEEDCLTLNIWRLRQAPAARRPVMVWLTGGGNHGLSGQGSSGFGGVNYNGEKLAPEGVLFVSFNIRLGVLGFLAHPALNAERPEKVSGNYGNLDQIAMLRWLRQNVAAFGGDPQRIFLFGTSAGGGNICALISSPLAYGLFHGAAMQSSVPTGCEIPTLADAQRGTGQRVAKATGCDAAVDIAACLRGKSVAEIVSAVPGFTNVFPRLYGPNMDGYVFPDQPLKVIERRRHAAMPVIIGSTTNETVNFVNAAGPVTDAATYAAAIEKVLGTAARDRILAAYPMDAYPTPRAAFVQLTTDSHFTCPTRRVARALFNAQKQPVFRYLFSHGLENDPQLKALGAGHTIEHPFFFPWQGKYHPTDTDLEVQRRMIGYWTRMARSDSPGGGSGSEWRPYSPEDEAYLEIGSSAAMKRGPEAAKCDFWDTVELPWPHL